MASFTITVPDAFISRIFEAFGHDSFPIGPRIPATGEEVKLAIRDYIKNVVHNYEHQIALRQLADDVGKEIW